MSSSLCKGGCEQKTRFKEWCGVTWQSGKKYAVSCPIVEKKRARSISRFRIEEAKQGKNPMQNPEICAKNHSPERAKKCSEKLKERGKLGLLPQQTESKKLKNRRRKRVAASLQKLWEQGIHPRQKETPEQRRKRMENVSKGIAEKIRTRQVSPLYGKVKPGKYKGIMFRSQWEKETAKFLDKYGFYWEYETIRVPYFDSERQRISNTLPDFYLPNSHAIIEVKGRWLESQKTKDKIKAIAEEGYSVVVIGEKEMELMRKNPLKLIQKIKEAFT